MTTPVLAQRNTVSAIGFSNPLNLPANAESDTHIKVYGDDVLLVEGVDYTVEGAGDVGDLDEIDGVNVLIEDDVINAAEFDTYTVVHDPPMDQDSDLTAGGTVGRLYTEGLDALARRLQALWTTVTRSLHLPPGAVGIVTELPRPEDRRGLVWELDQDTGDIRLVNTASDPDTEPLTNALAAQAAAEAAQAEAEAAEAVAIAQAAAASDSADRAEVAAANAGDLSALLNFLWPVGAKLEHFGPTAPANFLACDGSAVSRTTYSALFAVIGTTYGAGNGTTTFNLPTWNDGRFTRATGGAAAAQGVTQDEMIGPHGHALTINSGGSHTHTTTRNRRYGGNDNSTGNNNPGWDCGDRSGNGPFTVTSSSGGEHTHTGAAANNDGTENRPRNGAVLVCIKF